MADAQDLKSWDRKTSCGFESRHRHQFDKSLVFASYFRLSEILQILLRNVMS
jgi:hypothetical protein